MAALFLRQGQGRVRCRSVLVLLALMPTVSMLMPFHMPQEESRGAALAGGEELQGCKTAWQPTKL